MDFRYYRCSGTDAYRFGGERICSNTQIRAESLETEIWENVCKIVRNPGSLQQEDQDSKQRDALLENVDTLRAQRQKLRHGLERLIDSLAEGVIDKDQFTSRMNRTKARIADIDTKIGARAAGKDRRAHVRSVVSRPAVAAERCRLGHQARNCPCLCSAHRDSANEGRGCPPSTDGNECSSYGVDYGDIVPGVNAPLNARGAAHAQPAAQSKTILWEA